MASQKYKLPKGIQFADLASKARYKKVLDGSLNDYGFKPLVFINSNEPGSGKTRLARHILDVRYGSSVCCGFDARRFDLDRLLPGALERGYLFLDGLKTNLDCPELAALLTAREWLMRPLGNVAERIVEVDLQVIVTGLKMTLSRDLAARALYLNLA